MPKDRATSTTEATEAEGSKPAAPEPLPLVTEAQIKQMVAPYAALSTPLTYTITDGGDVLNLTKGSLTACTNLRVPASHVRMVIDRIGKAKPIRSHADGVFLTGNGGYV